MSAKIWLIVTKNGKTAPLYLSSLSVTGPKWHLRPKFVESYFWLENLEILKISKIKTKYLTLLSYHEYFDISPPILLFQKNSEKSQESAAVKTMIMKSD